MFHHSERWFARAFAPKRHDRSLRANRHRPVLESLEERTLLSPISLMLDDSGTNYYVATNGSDSNPGTLQAPWRTIQKAMNSVAAGSTVNIRGGTYVERALSVNVSGTAGNFITFQPYGFSVNNPGESVFLDYSSFGNNTSTTPVLSIFGKSYIRIQGLTFQNFTCTGGMQQGVRIDEGATNIEFLNNKLFNFQNTGPRDGSSALLLLDVWLSDNVTLRGNEIGYVVTNLSEALTLRTGSTHALVEGNYIHDTDAIGIDAWNGANNFTIRGNRLEYISEKRDGTYWFNTSAIGIYCDGGNTGVMEGNSVDYTGVGLEALAEPGNPAAHDITIRNNVVRFSEKGIVIGTWYSSTDGSSVYNINVYNNTFYQNDAGVVLRPMNSATVKWKNNIFALNSTNYVNSLGWDPGDVGYNLYFGNDTGPGAVVAADPQFVGAPTDLSLQSTSPAKDAGDPATTTSMAGSVDFAGNPRFAGQIDIGAYEYQTLV